MAIFASIIFLFLKKPLKAKSESAGLLEGNNEDADEPEQNVIKDIKETF